MGNNCRKNSLEVHNVKVGAGIASAEMGHCVSSCCMGATQDEEQQHARYDAELERKAAKLDEIITAVKFVKADEVLAVINTILKESEKPKD